MSEDSRQTLYPSLARATVSNPNSVQKFLDGSLTSWMIATGRVGNPLDRFLTPRDLFNAGLIRLIDGQGSVVSSGTNDTGFEPIPTAPEAPDLTTPATPTGLSVTGAITTNLLSWTAASYGNHAYTEIWRNSTDNQGTAVRIGTTLTAFYADSVGYNSATWYYWIRFVSTSDVVGAFNATAGTSATTQSSSGGTDTTAPGAITGLAATGGVKSIILTWTLPSDSDIDVVQIHRHTSNDRDAGGSIIAKVKGTIYSDPVSAGSTYYYWVRAVDSSGNIGAWNAAATSGVSGTTGTVSSSDLADGAVIAAKLAAASVSTAALQNLAVDNSKLAALAVDAAKLADSSVTSTKIANLAVGTAAIALLAVGTAQIADAAILTAKIGDLQVTTAKIVDLGITNAKIADATILGAKIANATIDDAKISTLSVAKLTSGTNTSAVINIGDAKFQLDGTGTNRHLIVQDNQGTPVTRVKIGKLGAGATDYGIQIFDPSGNPVIDVTGTVYGAKIDGLAASKILAGDITAVIGIYGPTISTQASGSTAERVMLESGSTLPFWYGTGTKNSANGYFYIDTSQPNTRKVVLDGKVLAREGQIASWIITGNMLYAGSGSTLVRIDASGGSTPVFSAGSATPASAPWRVYSDGSFTATNANITGTVNITGGTGFANLTDTPAGRGANLAHPKYSNFEEGALPTVSTTNGTASQVTGGVFGAATKALQLVATAGDNYTYLGASSSDYNIFLTPNKKVLLSAYVSSPQASASGELFLRTSSAGTHYSIPFTTSGTPNTWTRVYGVIDLTADSSLAAIIRVDNNTASNTMKYDGIMLEEVWGAGSTPSAYSEPGAPISALAGGLELASGYIRNGNNIVLDFANKRLSINSATYGSAGIQLEYNGGAPRAHIGDGTAYIKLESGAILAKEFKTATSGKRITINEGGNNEQKFYGDRGDGVIEELASIGIKAAGADYTIGNFGSLNSDRFAIYAIAKTTSAIVAFSETSHAIFASDSGTASPTDVIYASTHNANGVAIRGEGAGITPGYGGYFGGASSTANLVLPPTYTSNPSHTPKSGSLGMQDNGTAWYWYGSWVNVANKYTRYTGLLSGTMNGGATTQTTVAHGLGTDDVIVEIYGYGSTGTLSAYWQACTVSGASGYRQYFAGSNAGSASLIDTAAGPGAGQTRITLRNGWTGNTSMTIYYVIRPRNP